MTDTTRPATPARGQRILPIDDDYDTGGFFDAAKRGELVVRVCDGCSAVLHVPVAVQELVQAGRELFGRVDRSLLGQLQIDEQLGPVRGREELLRDKAHAVQGRTEQGQRDEDCDPARPHGEH